jgi:hypothetical protein
MRRGGFGGWGNHHANAELCLAEPRSRDMEPEVWHMIAEADYAEFRTLIVDLPPAYGKWLNDHLAQKRKMESEVIFETVSPQEFRRHLLASKPPTEQDLYRAAALKHALAGQPPKEGEAA